MSIESRLNKLETTTGGDCVVIWRHPDETDHQAKVRWADAHPGRHPDRVGTRAIIIGWLPPEPDTTKPI